MLFDHVKYPIGIPACPLTKDAESVMKWGCQGFNVLTFKTVRSVAHSGNPQPWLGYVSHIDGTTVHAVEDFGKASSLVNSIGMPSLAPQDWQEQIRQICLRSDQQLIVSVTGTGTNLVADFCQTAQLAAEVCPMVELNLSCPNEDHIPLFKDLELTQNVIESVRSVLPETCLLAKIGYVTRMQMPFLLEVVAPFVNGITAINTIPHRVLDNNEQNYFNGRPMAGVSGYVIRRRALDTIEALLYYRPKELAVIAVGGLTEEDMPHLREAGVDVVQVCTRLILDTCK